MTNGDQLTVLAELLLEEVAADCNREEVDTMKAIIRKECPARVMRSISSLLMLADKAENFKTECMEQAKKVISHLIQ